MKTKYSTECKNCRHRDECFKDSSSEEKHEEYTQHEIITKLVDSKFKPFIEGLDRIIRRLKH